LKVVLVTNKHKPLIEQSRLLGGVGIEEIRRKNEPKLQPRIQKLFA